MNPQQPPLDDERRAKLVEFVARLRTLCIAMGAQASLVNTMSASGLLVLYRHLLTETERERAELERLMQEPSRTTL